MKSTHEPRPTLRRGQLAEVIAGPNAGLIGPVADIEIDDGVLVTIELQGGRQIQADAEDVEALAI